MPVTLSSNTQKRKAKKEEPGTFYSSTGLGKCKDSRDSESNSDLYTTTFIPNQAWTIEGIQIPKSLEAIANCSLKEHFDFLILDSSDNVVSTFVYDQVPPCTTERYMFDTPESATAYDDNNLISVQFKPYLSIPSVTSEANRYKIKTVFYEKRKYPKWVDAGVATTSASTAEFSSTPYSQSIAFRNEGIFIILHKRPFVYSVFI